MRMIIRWLAYGAAMGGLTGSASALFLRGLDRATDIRLSAPWLLWLLPPAGALVSLLYSRYGGNAGKGNNLIVEQIRLGDAPAERLERVSAVMAPFVLIGTWATHLFGGSAGREGTAVQMGGSLAEAFGRLVRAEGADRRALLMSGVAGGFASVFGTPLAGAAFALEVVTPGRRISPKTIVPCAVAAFAGDMVTRAWGIRHLQYALGAVPAFSAALLAKIAAAAVLFGLMSLLFAFAVGWVKRGLAALIARAWLRSVAGGLLVIGLTYAAGTRDYLGLSLPLLVQAFHEPPSALAFLWKTAFTAVTLGSGFMGGEVTPLFVIGAALGSALAPLLHLGASFLAGLGLIGVFSGAANAPAACFFLGLELFGADGAAYMLVVCLVSYMFSGHAGIYGAQLGGVPKPRYFVRFPGAALLRDLLNRRKSARSRSS
ncbi:H+/Cl-antiporter ClcA [Paenibacillus sp. UNC496MF]|nr:H+/Cl-antiporter ClcA [Paenibacillus sp. UNC496MF]